MDTRFLQKERKMISRLGRLQMLVGRPKKLFPPKFRCLSKFKLPRLGIESSVNLQWQSSSLCSELKQAKEAGSRKLLGFGFLGEKKG